MKPCTDKLMKDKLQCAKCVLRDFVYEKSVALKMTYAVSDEPVPFSERATLEFKPIAEGEVWSSKLWECGWFHITGTLPVQPENRELYFSFDFEGEGCIFDGKGMPLRGITNVSSEFDRALGFPGKRYVKASELVESGDDKIDLWIETGNNDLFGNLRSGRVEECAVVFCDTQRRKLFYDYVYLLDLAESVSEDDPLHYAIIYALEKVAVRAAIEMDSQTIEECRQILKPHLDRKNISDPLLKFYAVGHSHLDLAWLWPLRESHRKAGRTFATALANLKEYPDYIYGASQPQQLDWVKYEYPSLFEKIKEAVKEGRFEVQGGMWVEADTNITSGESLIRQFVYGTRFWKEEFGKEVETLWLPDVFGFSGALPQIIKGCGCENFLTIKLSWNMVNEFPFHSFKWQGIDGSEVLVHMPPEGTYNSSASPKAVRWAAGNYSQRGISKNALMLYGIGDGGGGPGKEHLENIVRSKDIYGVPNVVTSTSEEFFRELRKEIDLLPIYKGEIYLEKHQGTYTSQSDNKYYNRRMENALCAYEFSQVLTDTYEKQTTDEIWKEVLLYQFHDIIPGSSIKRVYDESVASYKVMLEKTTERTEKILSATGNEPCVLNATSFLRSEYVLADGKWYEAVAEPFSVAKLKEVKGKFGVYAELDTVGNALVEVKISDSGTINSIIDKRSGKEALKMPSGEYLVFDDSGDGWDFYHGYRGGNAKKFILCDKKAFVNGANGGLKLTYKYGKSTLYQTISVTEGSPLVRIDVKVDWHELEKMLRTDFYPDIDADEVTCDIQFGSVKRTMLNNNSHQQAQYEVCSHKWVDMSSLTHGVALINDSKYGYSCKNGCISMNLLRSQKHPCVAQDNGEHSFSYAIYLHENDIFNSDVAARSYAFNRPLTKVEAAPTSSFVSSDNQHAVIETVKPSENGKGYIVRIYNDRPDRITAKITCQGRKMTITDMLERDKEATDGVLSMHGYEVVTMRVER